MPLKAARRQVSGPTFETTMARAARAATVAVEAEVAERQPVVRERVAAARVAE